MMSGLFVIMTGAIATLYFGRRGWGISLLLIALVLCWLMLWYHATSTLEINW